MSNERHVGLLIFTKLPDLGLVAILQKRGEFDDERMKPESAPAGCQLTVWGGIDEGETAEAALLREVYQEIGFDCGMEFSLAAITMKNMVLLRCGDEDPAGRILLVHAWMVGSEFIRKIRWHPASGGMRVLTEDRVSAITHLNNYPKYDGVPDWRETAMFSDAKAILTDGFWWAKQADPEF